MAENLLPLFSEVYTNMRIHVTNYCDKKA